LLLRCERLGALLELFDQRRRVALLLGKSFLGARNIMTGKGGRRAIEMP
jgi:hypothetical protein